MSHEKIKVAYSWIGPRGPIWNTELPNVYSFAGAAEQVDTHSHHWWTDDTWRNHFRHDKDSFEMAPVCTIENDERPLFIMPFTLSWRIPIDHYFCGHTGLLEYAHVPGHIMWQIRNANGFIMIDHGVEAFMEPFHLRHFHGYFGGIQQFSMDKIIYLTGAMNAEELYEKFCYDQGIPDDPIHRMKVIPYPSAQYIFRPNTEMPEDEPAYDTTTVPQKLFLMWNRRIRPHRIRMVLNLERNDLIERSYVSFVDQDIERPNVSVHNTVISTAGPHANMDVVSRFLQRLPLVIDGESDINRMCEDRGNVSRPFYQSSLVSIVTETNFELNSVTLTEKSFKPFKEKHPFITVGVHGCLKAMHKLGFKTFGEFWDESYDDEKDPALRMQKLNALVSDIGAWSDDRILDFKKRVEPILNHNYALLRDSNQKALMEHIAEYMREHYR